MAVRVVEGKKPYTGGKAISIDENKVISLNLRADDNLIIYDEGDNEIYVDLQLPDGIVPTDAFPIGCNVGRVSSEDGWDVTGTIVSFQTTSGDNIKLLYGDDNKLYIDNGTGTFKQIYFKADVDAIVATLSSYINTRTFYLGDDTDTTTAKSAVDWYLEGKNPIISQAGVLYYCVSFDSHHFMTFRSFRYYGETGTHSNILKEDRIVFTLDSDNEVTRISIGEDDVLEAPVYSAGTGISIDQDNVISATGGGGSDIEYVTQAEYTALLPGAASDGKHYFIYTRSTPTDRPDITSFSYTSSATTGKVNCHSFCCVPSGEYVYITDGDGPIYEYSLSDSTLNTLTYVTSKSGIKSRGAYVKDDGTVLYSCVDGSPYTYTVTMGTPYNISTASSTTHSLPSNTTPTGGEFSTDGVYFYCGSWGNAHSVYQYTCSTPRDLSTATLTMTKDLSANLNNKAVYCERFSPTGLKLYVSVRSSSEVHQFNLSTAWDISTASYFGTLTLSTSYGGDGYGIGFCNNGTRLFAHTCTNNASAVGTIVQYDAS